jgi:hypothetical protein
MRTHRKQTSSTATQTYEAHSTYAAALGAPDRCRYRRTPPGAPGLGRLRTVNDENLVRVGFEQLQDAVADGDAFVDPGPVAIAVF